MPEADTHGTEPRRSIVSVSPLGATVSLTGITALSAAIWFLRKPLARRTSAGEWLSEER